MSPLGECRGKELGTLLVGSSLAGRCRGRDAKKCLLTGSICGPQTSRTNSAGTSARSERPLLPSGVHAPGPGRTRSCRSLLRRQLGWGEAGGLRAQPVGRWADGLAGGQEAAKMPGCQQKPRWRQARPRRAPKQEGRLWGEPAHALLSYTSPGRHLLLGMNYSTASPCEEERHLAWKVLSLASSSACLLFPPLLHLAASFSSPLLPSHERE